MVSDMKVLLHLQTVFRYLQDGQDMLSYHGYDNDGGSHSCCKWGRGNGWGMMSHMEALACVQEFPELFKTGIYDNLMKLLQEHSMALIRSGLLRHYILYKDSQVQF